METHNAPTTTAHTDAQTTTSLRVDVAHVRELLESAARRHRKISEQVVEFGDDPSAAQYPVKDVRKCDHVLSPVPRRPYTAASAAASARSLSTSSSALKAQQQRRSSSASATASATASTASSAATDITAATDSNSSHEADAWRVQLQQHAMHLLQTLRARPEHLRDFLLVRYDDEREASARQWLSVAPTESDESSSDDDDADVHASHVSAAAGARRARVYKKRIGTNYAKLRFVCAQLHAVALRMGVQLFAQVRAMVRRSVANGALSRSANIVRLASIYKLELRRHVTIESLLAAVRTDATERKRKRRCKRHDEQHVRAQTLRRSTGATSDNDARPASAKLHQSLYDRVAESAPAKSAHAFRMHALERVLAAARRRDVSNPNALSLVSEQTDELVHDKVAALLTSKSRDAFPVWRESAYTRDETLQHLTRAVALLRTTALFRSLPVDDVLEFARATTWRMLECSAIAVERGASMDELVLVMDGQLELLLADPNDASSDSNTVDPRSPLCVGELGLLNKSQVWPTTLCASATQSVRMLVLSRAAFDAVVLKLYGSGNKSRSALVVTQPSRPASSPAATARSSRANGAALSLPRPLTAAAAVATRQPHAVPVLSQQLERLPATATDARPSLETPLQTRTTPTPKSSVGRSAVQHYPSFASTDSSSVAHAFRLKYAPPIAFDMASLDASILDEWSPAMPDTSDLVDYLSPTSVATTCRLFANHNLLLKHRLRAACFGHDDEFLNAGCNNISSSTTLTTSTTLSTLSASFKTGSSASRRTLLQPSASVKHLLSSSSSSSGLASSSAAALKLANVPFARSSFVTASSFAVGRRRVQPTLPANAERDTEDDDDNNNNDASSAEHSQAARSTAVVLPHQTNSDVTASCSDTAPASVSDVEINTTRARKMALDSLLTTLDARRSSTEQSRDAARDRVVATYLSASQPPNATPRALRTTPAHQSIVSTANNTVAASSTSDAPLPLRVDLQQRVERVFTTLAMPPAAKLALVLKYTNAAHYDAFPRAVVLWEHAQHYITQREQALANLWAFELVASDPRRHFRSLSTLRLQEQKQRDALLSELQYKSDLCRDALAALLRECGDTVSVAGRVYTDKMAKDYTELLYDVEQERLRLIYKDVHPSVNGVGGATASSADRDIDNSSSTQSLLLTGTTTASGKRYRLANPQESIYVNVVEQQHQQDAQGVTRQLDEVQQAAQQALYEQRRSSLGASHRMAQRVQLERQSELHALTQRLQIEKQTGVAADDVRPASRVGSASAMRSTGRSSALTLAASSELTAAATAAKSERALLQRALHRFLHRPQS